MPRARGLPPAAPGDDGSPATVTGAHYRLHVAKRKKRDRRSPPLQVAVFAYPSLDLTHACELVKTGVIYGDSVRLISPTATLLAGIAAMANPDRTQLPAVVRMMLEVTGRSDPSVLAGIATWENLIRKRARNAAELNAVKQAERQMQTALVEMRDTVDDMIIQSGGHELIPAIEAGLLEPLDMGIGDNATEPDLIDVFLERISEALSDSTCYPVFDDDTAAFVRLLIDDQRVDPRAITRTRARQAAMNAGVLRRLPAFPRAGMSEVVDLRAALDSPLRHYRTAIGQLGHQASSEGYEEDFDVEVEAAWTGEIADALDELDELISENRYISELARVVGDNPGPVVAIATSLAVAGVSTEHELAAGLAASSTALLSAAVQHARTRRAIERKPYFLLHLVEGLDAE